MQTPINQETENPFAGMTVNERLGEAGLFEVFDRAAFAHDEQRLRTILSEIRIENDSATRVIEWVITSPDSPYRNPPIAQRMGRPLVLGIIFSVVLLTLLPIAFYVR